MSKQEQEISGFIIKSQDLGEADLLLTFFSGDQGKIRAIVKSAKKMTSKLSGNLQPYILSQITVVGEASIPKIIGVQPLVKYSQIITNQNGMQVVLAMQELVIRSLADGQPNSELFSIYKNTLQELNELSSKNSNSLDFTLLLTKFYIQTLTVLGFSPQLLQADKINSSQQIFFSMQNGKFTDRYIDSGDMVVSIEAYKLLKQLMSSDLEISLGNTIPIMEGETETVVVELLVLLTKFASYQLERELRATLHFTMI